MQNFTELLLIFRRNLKVFKKQYISKLIPYHQPFHFVLVSLRLLFLPGKENVNPKSKDKTAK